ncbi:uncharacterized protein LOC133173921 [Saccostrea echinata]|uniref:uncharacterized protein LOC133173921 n=1 Tax=Saccostrea echinata TaxID=191078 RepID=UPI002A83FE31|nr:uncharacterized protein LOC133173921 [Saccostrea echinata]
MSTSLIILSLAVVTVAAGKLVNYCDVEKQFYVKQWGQCKACDRCPRGYGLNSKRDVRLDPVHGALHCRGCVKCVPGETFNSEIGYGECLSCTNCTAHRKTVITECTIETDTVCSKAAIQENGQIQSPQNKRKSVSQDQTNSDSKSDSEVNIGKQDQENTDLNPLLTWSGISAIAMFVPLSVVMFFRKNREKLNCWKKDLEISIDVQEQESLKKKDNHDVPVTLEPVEESASLSTVKSKVDCTEETSQCFVRQSVVSEDMPPLESDFYYSLSNEVPTYKEQHEISDEVQMKFSKTRVKRFNGIPTKNYKISVATILVTIIKDCEIQRTKEEQRKKESHKGSLLKYYLPKVILVDSA